jgi:uncharacterized protein (DUF2141 family)
MVLAARPLGGAGGGRIVTRSFCLAAALFVALAGSANAASLIVRATGIRSADGMVYAGICATGFDEAQCPYKGRAQARAGTVEIRVSGVKPGRYAIAIYHDVNGNGRLDKTLFLPSEPYGFSNDVGRGGVPSFQGALIDVAEPATTVVVPVR